MEGAAVVVIGLVLYPFFLWLKKKFTGKKRFLAYVISFFAGALLCTVIEFSMGLLVNADLQLWDYRENFCNIMGQVCLQNTMAFGVVAAIITWWVYPMLERLIARVPNDIMNIVAIVIFVFGGIVWSLYLINPPGVDEQNNPSSGVTVEAAQTENEQQRLATQLAVVNADIDTLEKLVDQSTMLDKEGLKESVRLLRADVQRMLTQHIGLERFPTAYQSIVASANDLITSMTHATSSQ